MKRKDPAKSKKIFSVLDFNLMFELGNKPNQIQSKLHLKANLFCVALIATKS